MGGEGGVGGVKFSNRWTPHTHRERDRHAPKSVEGKKGWGTVKLARGFAHER